MTFFNLKVILLNSIFYFGYDYVLSAYKSVDIILKKLSHHKKNIDYLSFLRKIVQVTSILLAICDKHEPF